MSESAADDIDRKFTKAIMLKLLQEKNQGIVILDEPSLHLHPIMQQRFWKVVSERNDNQVIAITHSPFLVNLNLFKNDKKNHNFVVICN